MKMRKLFAGLLATSIVAAGTSAFAAVENDAGYNKTAGTYSIVSDLAAYGSDQMTILIIPEAAYLAETINDADILYIDQAAADTANIFKSVGILGGTTLADGNYYVKIGGENIAEDGIIVEKFNITTKDDVVEITRLYGDVDASEEVDIDDAMEILYYYNFMESVFDDGAEWRLTAGDVDGSTEVDIDDAMEILYYYNFMESVFDTMDEFEFTYVEE
jgi:hypothetical protein